MNDYIKALKITTKVIIIIEAIAFLIKYIIIKTGSVFIACAIPTLLYLCFFFKIKLKKN